MANLLETVTHTGHFTTLLSGIETAELNDILQSEGPFTLLAPTDEAFAQIPEQELTDLQHNPAKLKQVLLYHVLFGDVRSDDLAQIDEAPTVEGSIVVVEQSSGIHINEAKVTETDILTDNGVIHVIDTVLMPTILLPE
jgi:uncharacterized surface protein with fasciclin (FAS1) repeats